MRLVDRKSERDTVFGVDTRPGTSYRRPKLALLRIISRERRNGSVGPQFKPLTWVLKCLMGRESSSGNCDPTRQR